MAGLLWFAGDMDCIETNRRCECVVCTGGGGGVGLLATPQRSSCALRRRAQEVEMNTMYLC